MLPLPQGGVLGWGQEDWPCQPWTWSRQGPGRVQEAGAPSAGAHPRRRDGRPGSDFQAGHWSGPASQVRPGRAPVSENKLQGCSYSQGQGAGLAPPQREASGHRIARVSPTRMAGLPAGTRGQKDSLKLLGTRLRHTEVWQSQVVTGDLLGLGRVVGQDT